MSRQFNLFGDDEMNIRCYDNGGKTADRYTVVYMDDPEGKGLFSCLGMSAKPFHPQGIGMHGSAMPGRHLGKRIAFESMPADCQRTVQNDLGLTMATFNQLAIMARHYVIAAIWADCPEGTNPRATKAAERIALERCTRFVELIGPLFDECMARHEDGYGMHPDCGRDEPACAAMGHDLYLTCAGHGVGFWDRKELDEGGLGDALTAHCKTMGEPDAHFYRGWLYFQ